ncbi:aspartate/glutamate racemase family protein [uncultured Lacinutrix sp.]|uniref:aspartate/glutamate racemase family protein n=1 Tax=uncultured Lacinutrix sp. TaxID=574032 RepID=UPI00261BF76B|nr:aspartate/glutamate racemase family protein [uncultured Lacinutrix sp.]
MSTLGLLGLGSFSTLFYIKELNALYNAKHGGFSTCPFKMLNVDFNAINNLLPNTSKALDTIVKDSLNKLQNLQIDTIVVPNITLHETIDRLNIRTNLIHPIEETISRIKESKHANVTIFGTLYTMQSNYITSKFTAQNITILQASKEDMQQIDDLRIAIYNGKETEAQLVIFNKLINKYTKNGIVVLACTELSVAYNIKNSLVYDMARIQILKSINLL